MPLKLFPSPGSPSPSPGLPAFLAAPLASPSAFAAVLATLTAREQARASFASLSHASMPVPRPGAFAVTAGTCRDAVRKNRYQDIVAYDRTRVLLPGGEYVNASLVGAPELGLPQGHQERDRSWVAAQVRHVIPPRARVQRRY